MKPWRAAALVTLAASGCLQPAPAAPAQTPKDVRVPPVPTSSVAPSAASVPGRLELALVASWLWMDGKYVAPFRRIDYVALFERLRQRHAAEGGGGVSTFQLRLDATADPGVTQNILGLTGDAGYERAELVTATSRLNLCTEECRGSSEADGAQGLRTAVLLRRDGVEIWSGQEVAPDLADAVAPGLERLLRVSWAGDELETGVQRVCAEGRCSRIVVYFDAELPGRGLSRVLESLDRSARAAGGAPPILRLGLSEPPAPGEETYAFVRLSEDGGRLPPIVIRQVVRAAYGTFRECYMRGLRENPKLTGQVSVRFVILADGSVSGVSEGTGDLPNDVTDCVLHGFTRLRFPAPGRGVVTVQYPIAMIPG